MRLISQVGATCQKQQPKQNITKLPQRTSNKTKQKPQLAKKKTHKHTKTTKRSPQTKKQELTKKKIKQTNPQMKNKTDGRNPQILKGGFFALKITA